MAYTQPPKKTGLPREVLKWLQSLDLSFFPKNMRRDFSNGYLVAEMFSWYYHEDFPMHSYNNGTSLPAKQGNWAQIERVKVGGYGQFLAKQNIHLLKEVLDGTIHCKPGAAELLVQEIYTILTNRRIKGIQGGEIDFTDRDYQDQLPMLARATASKAIKNNLRLTEVIAEPNISTNQRKVQAIIHMHLEQRAAERAQNPKRFNVKPTLGELAVRLPPSSHHGDDSSNSNTSVQSGTAKSCEQSSRSKASVHSIESCEPSTRSKASVHSIESCEPSTRSKASVHSIESCEPSTRSKASVHFKEIEVRQTDRRSLITI